MSLSLRTSSPIWASEVSLARTREGAAKRGSLRLPKQESLLAGYMSLCEST